MELMIAVAILVVVISGLLSTFIQCLLLNEVNHNAVIAMNDAQYVLEEIRGLTYNQTLNYTNADLPTFNNLNNENVTLVKNNATIINLTVYVNWTERQRARSISLSTRKGKAH
jgi:type II secretory pathway pseudopilin PulG